MGEDRRADGVGDPERSRADGKRQRGRAEGRKLGPVQRVDPDIGHAPEQQVDPLQPVERLDVGRAAPNRQVGRLDQARADVAREIGVAEEAAVVLSAGQEREPPVPAQHLVEVVLERGEVAGQPAHADVRERLGHGLRGRDPVGQQPAVAVRRVQPVGQHDPPAVRCPGDVGLVGMQPLPGRMLPPRAVCGEGRAAIDQSRRHDARGDDAPVGVDVGDRHLCQPWRAG